MGTPAEGRAVENVAIENVAIEKQPAANSASPAAQKRTRTTDAPTRRRSTFTRFLRCFARSESFLVQKYGSLTGSDHLVPIPRFDRFRTGRFLPAAFSHNRLRPDRFVQIR